MADFARQAIVDQVVLVLESINALIGYNTQPFVTQDPREIVGREEEFMLLVMPSNETVVEVGIGGCHEMELEIDIYGYCQTKEENPVTRLNMLLQDVRNVLHQGAATISDVTERGLAFRFGDLLTDEGMLAQSSAAGFIQTAHFVYKNGSTW